MAVTPRRICLSLLLALAIASSGCSSIHLYNAGRDKQGAEAKKAWSDVDLSGLIATERPNLEKLLAAELATQDRLATAIRDQQMLVMISTKPLSETLVPPLESWIEKLTGKNWGYQKFIEARIKLENDRNGLADARETLEIDLRMSVSCEDARSEEQPPRIKAALEKAKDVLAKESLARLKARCEAVENAEVGLTKLVPAAGRAGAAGKQWLDDKAAIAAAEAQTAQAAKEYEKALDEYNQAVKATSPASPGYEEKLKGIFKKINDAVDKLEKVQGGFGKQFVAQDRLNKIEQIVKVLSGSEKLEAVKDEELRSALGPVIVLPHLVDEGIALLQAAKRPRATPFLIEKEHQRLLLESANREVDGRKRSAQIAKEIFDALVEEAELLHLVKHDLEGIAAVHARSLSEVLDDRSFKQAQALYSILGRYLDAIGRIDARAYKLEYQRIAAIHDAALAKSEVAILMWNNLIGTSVEQVSSFHASGLRPETIIQALQAAGVLWIGRGVNR